MHLMRPFIAALAQIPAFRNAELAQIFVAQRLEIRAAFIGLRDGPHHRHNVDDGLCSQPGHRRAADVMDGREPLSQHPRDGLRLRFIKARLGRKALP